MRSGRVLLWASAISFLVLFVWIADINEQNKIEQQRQEFYEKLRDKRNWYTIQNPDGRCYDVFQDEHRTALAPIPCAVVTKTK